MAAQPRTEGAGPSPEARLERIATAAHGVVTRAEALAAGVTRSEIEQRLATGSLLGVHRGVYRLGHRAPSHLALYMAAVKACGEGAALSGRAAAHLLRLLSEAPAVVEVTAPTARTVPGVLVHRSRRGPLERAFADGIPVTTPARTLVDLAARLDRDDLSRACHQAFIHHRSGPRQVRRVLRDHPRTPGSDRLLRMLEGDNPITLSRMERRFLQLLKQDGLEWPATNERVGSYLVDCRWPHLHLTVELDSYRFHGSRRAWERDRRRDREARLRGDELLRYVYEDVFEQPEAMLAELRERIPRVGRRAPRANLS